MHKGWKNIRVKKDSENLHIMYSAKGVTLGYAIMDTEEFYFHFAQGVVGQGGAWDGPTLEAIGSYVEELNSKLSPSSDPPDDETESPAQGESTPQP